MSIKNDEKEIDIDAENFINTDEKSEKSVDNAEFVELNEEGEEFSDSQKTKNKIKDLREKLEIKEKEAKEYLDGWQRSRAELVNKEKLLLSDRQDFIKAGNRRLMEAILPSLDNFEMAKRNKDAWEKVDSNWRIGIDYIFTNLQNAMEDEGLSEIKPKTGDKFDVNTMESLEEVETEDAEKDHTVSEIIQSGYKHYDKLLRPAKVKVFIKK
jgi:molecular chaperone GrpE